MNENQPPTEDPVPEEHDERAPWNASSEPSSPEPDWLRDMSGDQATPDWLRRLFDDEDTEDEAWLAPPEPEGDVKQVISDEAQAQEPAASAEPAGAEEPAGEPGEFAAQPDRPSTDDLRRYFRAAEDEQPLPTDQEEPPTDRETLPEWLQALDATPPTDQPASAAAPEGPIVEDDDLPDWLRALDQEPRMTPTHAEEPVGPTVERQLPDWLAAPGDGPEDRAAPDAPPPTEQPADDLPDWLQEMTEELAGQPDEPEDLLPEPEEVPPEQEAIDPGQERLPDAALYPPAPPDQAVEEERAESEIQAEAEVPAAPKEAISWVETRLLREIEPTPDVPPAADAAPAPDVTPVPDAVPVPDEAAEPEPAPSWLGESDQEPGAELPDWLAGAREEPEPEELDLDLTGDEPGEETETPEWIQDLRPERDARQPARAAAGVPGELEAETSGPLAGLTGLLSPQPVAGLTDRAVFKPAPPVPDEQHALVTRIQELLSEPPARPVLPAAAPGRPVLRALGHWLIYLALVAVIVAAMFVPALYEWILSPETQAGQDAYVALHALPADSTVLLVIDYDAAHDGELTPLTRVLLWHLITSGQRVVVVSHTPQGAAMAQELLESRALWAYGPAPTMGVHALNLGYLPPHPASMQAFMANPAGGAVLWGENILAQETPLGQEIAQFGDLNALVLVSANPDHARWWIEQTASSLASHSMPLLAGLSASAAPTLLPYGHASSAQLSGTLVGLAGAAEYERLCGARFAPNARQNMILQGSAQILFAAIVLVSGISLVLRQIVGRKG